MGGVNVKSTTDPRDAVPLFTDFEPDLVLLDLTMPHLDGFEVMEQLRPLIPAGTYLPILVLTTDITLKTKRKALAAGAKDFLTKPLDANEFLLRVGNLLETRSLYRQVQEQNQKSEKSQSEFLQCLGQAITLCDEKQGYEKSDTTSQHAPRVGRIATLLAQVLEISSPEAELIGQAAVVHDVGRIGIPDHIPLKPGKLTAEEFEIMKGHTVLGARLLSGGNSALLQMAERIALTHHERWDGSGYPQGLQGEAIPLEGRIVAVAECFDALSHKQPYREAWTVDEAVAAIKEQSGQQFDPRVVEAFLILPYQMLI